MVSLIILVTKDMAYKEEYIRLVQGEKAITSVDQIRVPLIWDIL